MSDVVAALRVQGGASLSAESAPVPGPQSFEDASSLRTLLVMGAHAGAGASMVAVGVADALAESASDNTAQVCLLDAAADESSGLRAAAERAIAGRNDQWQFGHRRSSTIVRPAHAVVSPNELPTLPPMTGSGLLVVDSGWSWRAVLASRGELGTLREGAFVVLVCRATVPSVQRAEIALAALATSAVVAAVGAGRWPREARAAMGPLLNQVEAEDRAVLVPRNRRVEVNGIDSDPLPRPILEAASRLVELWGTTFPATFHEAQQRKGIW